MAQVSPEAQVTQGGHDSLVGQMGLHMDIFYGHAVWIFCMDFCLDFCLDFCVDLLYGFLHEFLDEKAGV